MQVPPQRDVYSAREIAAAAGVLEADVLALFGVRHFVSHAEALSIGRAARRAGTSMFLLAHARRRSRVPLVLSSFLHIGAAGALLLLASWAHETRATTATDHRIEPTQLVFLRLPGPGGGGGGGGLLQKAPPAKALLEGRQRRRQAAPVRVRPTPAPPPPVRPAPRPPPLEAEPLPTVVAPIVAAPADPRSRIGVLLENPPESEARGPGRGGGAGTGSGTGLGEGTGSGIGPGSGGGTGGGPYRAGSGIEAPRILREVKADYSDDARRRGITGDVVLEIVVLRDGSVGDIKIVRGLDGGLSERAVQAVRQWRFVPARRLGMPVDVIVEVAVEFKLR
jgi:protein TonB